MLKYAEEFVMLMKIVRHLMSNIRIMHSTVILMIKGIQQVIIQVLAMKMITGLVISSKQRPMLLPIPKLKEMKLPLPILKLKKPLPQPLPNLIKMPPMDPLEKKLNPNILYLLVCA